MAASIFTRQKLKILESISPVDAGQECLSIMETFLVLDRREQKEFADAFYEWASQNAGYKPILFSYAKLILAFQLFYSENYDIAFPLIIEAQQVFTDLDNKDFVAICQVLQGGIYRTFGNVDLALQSSLAGYSQLSKSGGSPHFLMACSINIGNIYFEQKHFDEAIPLFKSTFEMAEPVHKYYWIIYALHGLGKVYLAQQKFPEAKDCFTKAMEFSERFDSAVSKSNSLSELGNYYSVAGDYKEAVAFHERALKLRELNNFSGGAVTSCTRLAEIYIQENLPAKAIAILDLALNLSAQIKVKLKMYQVHLLLSQIYEQQRDPEKSLFHYKKFYELREQVEREDNERKIKNAQLVFAGEQVKKENVIIKKQKEEIEKKNIELQETIDKLTRAKIGKKARAFTLAIAVAFFIIEDFILHFALTVVNSDNYFISIVVKMLIIFSLSPINKAIEAYLLRKVIKKRRAVLV